MRINHNVLALNGWRNLTETNNNLSKSLEKLSSGYRINRAADDPAGLVISEKLRAEITGVDQAVNNTQDAVSMIQVAEGALVEMNSLLNSMRALALHAANTGASSTAAIAADQEQIDSAVNSIKSIAQNTAYLGRKLLDGTSGNSASVVDSANVANVTVGTGVIASGTHVVSATVTTIASQATVTTRKTETTSVAGGTVTVNGVSVTLAAGTSRASAASVMQTALNNANAGVNVKYSAAGVGSGSFVFTSQNYGSKVGVIVQDAAGAIYSTGGGTAVDYGADVAGTINGSAATGSGLTLKSDTGTNYAGTAVTLTAAGNALGSKANAVSITGNAVTFQIGANAGEAQKVSLRNVNVDHLGTSVHASGLNAIKSGAAYNLATDPTNALKVIDAAIDDVSKARADLGALTKNVLETKVRSLEVSRENLQSSESRIRDVDMAKEMMEFTRNQIMTQAGTAMLAQANSAPQAVLKLLG